jgi:hypothetical protein
MALTPLHDLRIHIDPRERTLLFDYEPGTRDVLFDICDGRGDVLKTGHVEGPVTQVRLSDVSGDDLVLMVLDGEVSSVRPFHLSIAS